MEDKFIFNLAPTGMIPTKQMSPQVPVAPEEIIEEVLAASDLGVNMVHLHARDRESGLPTYKKEIYAEIIRGIRAGNRDLVICVSTSGRHFSEFEKRSQVLELEGDLKPDFASLTPGSLNFHDQASTNSPQMIKALAQKMLKNSIKPELEIFDLGMLNYTKYLIRKDFIPPPYYWNLIMGSIAGAQADLLALGLMVNELPDGSIWSAGGIGDAQLKMNAVSLAAGGGVRVGLEDNIWYDSRRTRRATNTGLVERIINIAGELGRRPYTCREARDVLGL